MIKSAELFCDRNGFAIDKCLGRGNYGIAYRTKCSKVVKVTTDDSEFVLSHSILGLKNKFSADILKIDVINSKYVILQELMDTSSVYDTYYNISNVIHKFAYNFDYDELKKHNLSKQSIKMISDISSSIQEYKSAGNKPEDISVNNIGLKSNGNYGLFDQRYSGVDVIDKMVLILSEIHNNRDKPAILKII